MSLADLQRKHNRVLDLWMTATSDGALAHYQALSFKYHLLQVQCIMPPINQRTESNV